MRPHWVEPRESYRLRRALDRLTVDDEPEMLLRSWLASRAARRQLSAPDAQALRSDARVVLPEVPVPHLLLAADLADHNGPRELARARELIGDWPAARRGGDT
jgi:hypothetical protein